MYGDTSYKCYYAYVKVVTIMAIKSANVAARVEPDIKERAEGISYFFMSESSSKEYFMTVFLVAAKRFPLLTVKPVIFRVSSIFKTS